MNMNSLIIVADASRARLFRTAQTNVAEAPVELVELDSVEAPVREAAHRDRGLADRAQSDADLDSFAIRVAERVARFASHHFCNPVVVTAPQELSASLVAELEYRLSDGCIHRIAGDFSGLPAPELLHELQKREAFGSPGASTPGTIAL